jgi:hypothetical protein
MSQQNNSSATSYHMKKHLLLIVVPAAIAASLLVGCNTPSITARTHPGRPSIVQVQEGYDTVGRRWSDEARPSAASKPQMLSRNEVAVRTFTGAITDIDYENREVTLKSSDGRAETFAVDKSVKRFNEAKVGDKVYLTYYSGFNAQVRKPTAEEQQSPLVVLEATGRSGPSDAPAGSNMRETRAVVTIEGLDRADQSITVKGPRGKYYIARVDDPSRFDDVHIGDTIVMTFTEAAAISLDPAE